MSRPNPAVLFVALAACLALIGGAEILKGGLFVAKHEGDTLHLLDIVLRMAQGQRIHQDFMTPLGVLAFLPFSSLMAAGFSAGMALILGQVMVGAVLLPFVWYSAATRLPALPAYLFGLYCTVMSVALTYGDADATLSMSMHYNRWAWVLGYIALLLALVPPRKPGRALVDGVVLGLALGALALLKITYFVALFAPIGLSLVLRRSWLTVAACLVTGLVVALGATIWGGFGYWEGYVGDLYAVSTSPLRSYPGEPPGNLAGGPAFLGVNLVLLLAVALLRQAGQDRVGLVLLLFLPAALYITLQNFGNDPQWLVLLVVLLLALQPGPDLTNGWGWQLQGAFRIAAAAAFAFALPSVLNVSYSAWRHLWIDAAEYVPIIPDDPRFADLGLPKARYATINGMVALDGEGSGLEQFREVAERKNIVSLNGEDLRLCDIGGGLEAWLDTIAADLEQAGYGGRRILDADLLDAVWLFGDFPPVRGAAAWYYGGTPGLEDAEFVMVPDCAVSVNSRNTMVEAIQDAGYRLEEVRRAPLYTLYRPVTE